MMVLLNRDRWIDRCCLTGGFAELNFLTGANIMRAKRQTIYVPVLMLIIVLHAGLFCRAAGPDSPRCRPGELIIGWRPGVISPSAEHPLSSKGSKASPSASAVLQASEIAGQCHSESFQQ